MEYVVNITAVDQEKNAAITVFTVRYEAERVPLTTMVNAVMDLASDGLRFPKMADGAVPLDMVAKAAPKK